MFFLLLHFYYTNKNNKSFCSLAIKIHSLRPATEVAVLEDANKEKGYCEVCYLHYSNGKFINADRKKICQSYCLLCSTFIPGKARELQNLVVEYDNNIRL